MIWGAAFGVVAHYYLLLSNLLIPATSFGAVFLKLVVDQVPILSPHYTQLLWTPFANTLFFFSISVMEVTLEHTHSPLESPQAARRGNSEREEEFVEDAEVQHDAVDPCAVCELHICSSSGGR